MSPVRRKSAPKKKTSASALQKRIVELQRQVMVAERLRHESLRPKSGHFDAATFVAGVAHEFNNILGAADGHAEWALESGKDADMREALGIVRLACRRSSQITQGLQGLFQPREEKKILFELSSVTDELTRMFKARCEKEGVRLHVEVPALQLYGEPGRMLEVLVNLVKNAFESFQNTPSMKSPTREKVIAIEGEVRKNGKKKFMSFLVRDNGPGIPEIYHALIFQPFFTTKGTLANALPQESLDIERASGVGSGLGLYLSRQIVEEHGGTIDCLIVDAGTAFEIRLPLAD